MGRAHNSSAYRDTDEEFFSSLEEANCECHESPAKKTSPCSRLSESTILHKHLAHRQAVRTKTVVTLSLMLLAGVGTAALYSSVDASAWAVKMRSCNPMFRSSSTTVPVVPNSGEVFEGDDSPDFGNAILGADEPIRTYAEDDEAQDDLLLDDLDPYEEFHQAGNELEKN